MVLLNVYLLNLFSFGCDLWKIIIRSKNHVCCAIKVVFVVLLAPFQFSTSCAPASAPFLLSQVPLSKVNQNWSSIVEMTLTKQWNPVNTATKGPPKIGRISGVAVLTRKGQILEFNW